MLFFYTSRLTSYVRRATFAVNADANGASLPLVHRHWPCATVQTNDKPSLDETLRGEQSRRDYVLSRARRRGRTARYEGRTVGVPTFLFLGRPCSSTPVATCPGCSANPETPRSATRRREGPPIRPEQVLHAACQQLTEDFNGNGCTNSSLCSSKIIYGNSANTTGVYSTETLTLAPGVIINNFSFGCGHSQRGPFDNFDGHL
ncbi:hypothetical protein PR202_ga17083 [Eleusine coracana subsp. coracana]|uniref:Xylanase inhibitor N-terminal domain-containing protein n=1 Tax=Eleusine coracana subsp. coracana TaxID=191504 RepID=A0AAV5CPC4_ELECO|nr:hypothetical protein PR202_ga17083 [Eleusine coracana subsp. coracana]